MPSDITDITDITVRSELAPAQRDAVLELVSAAEAVDGASALSEQFRLAGLLAQRSAQEGLGAGEQPATSSNGSKGRGLRARKKAG